jgi:CMP-N-acetylneuraminic acid synthetase
MKNGKKIVGIIPARLGSRRVKTKNLRLLGGKPLIYYAIQAVKGCSSFDETYVNSESELFGQVAERYGMAWYKRPPELAVSSSLIDEYIYEFIASVPCDVLAVINPTSPFITSTEIDAAVDNFLASDCDTQLACEEVQTHCFLSGQAVNFSTDGLHPGSETLEPIKALNFAVTIWDAHKFKEQYEREGHGVYTGKLGFFTFEGLSTVDIDYEEDFALAEGLMASREAGTSPVARYDPVLDEIISAGHNTET